MMMLTGFCLLLACVLGAHARKGTEGCSADGKSFEVGETYSVLGQCTVNMCLENGEWGMLGCGLTAAPDKWVFIPEDTSKLYPDCCGYYLPPLDIVPDILDKRPGTERLKITYEGGNKVDLGNELTPTQVKSEPQVSYRADPDSYYLLCMTDPDAPSRENPSSREFRHWLVGNIPGRDVSRGEVLTEYVGSGAPEGTGLHRYTFLLYKQPCKLTFDEQRVNNTSQGDRAKFSIQTLAEKYELGDPLAVNMFQAQYDDYVPVVLAQLGINLADFE